MSQLKSPAAKRLVIDILQKIVKETDNDLDDIIVLKMKQALNASLNRANEVVGDLAKSWATDFAKSWATSPSRGRLGQVGAGSVAV